MIGDLANQDVVLVVDDSREELGMLVEALGQAGFTALAATGGDAALALLERVLPHVVIMDALMPGIDGFATCRRLKSDARFSQLPVIFMTGLSDTQHVIQGLEAGGVDYITKPVVIAELLARIRVHVANARTAMGARAALDATGRYLLACDRQGRVLWSTPQTAALLAMMRDSGDGEGVFAGGPNDPVSLALQTMIAAQNLSEPYRIEGTPAVTLTFLSETAPDELLFRLAAAPSGSDEQVLSEKLAITLREAEILLWVARGKANRDISDILKISPRTVNKHLERVFAKIGVENRASATSVAMRVLAAHQDRG